MENLKKYYVHGIIDEIENIGMNVFAISEDEAIRKVTELIKERYDKDTFEIAEVILINQ